MKIITKEIGYMRCKKPDDHKFEIYITTYLIDRFGKPYTEKKIFDTVLESELNYYTEQAKKLNGMEYNQEILIKGC